ncbi:hypothetical protein E1B13_23545 [Salmonella enterica subsp. enterica]|nr:hypothetical protein [Salmonella enterica subsp. enterica]
MKQKIISSDDFIKQLLTGWVDANNRYVNFLGKHDCCWWYNERTNVSVLAGAAWTLGWAAIEEYPSRKKMKGCVQDDLYTSKGRVDLYITNSNDDVAIEAKHAWYLLENTFESNRILNFRMDEAYADAKRLINQAGNQFAATFIVFYTKMNAEGTINENHIDELISKVISKRGEKQSSYAYIFDSQFNYKNELEYYYPSVALILEKVNC